MEAGSPLLSGQAAQRVWHEILRPAAVQMRLSAAEITGLAVSRVSAEAPELLADGPIIEDVLASTEDTLRQLAEIIEVAADPAQAELPPATIAIFRSAVWRRVPLTSYMRFYRIAQDEVWRWLLLRIRMTARDADDLATAMELMTSWLFVFVDGAMTRANEAYEIERETWLRGDAATRAAAIDDILADRERDSRTATKRLRYDVSRHHLGVIVWLDHAPDSGHALSLLTAAVDDIARCVAADASITHPSGPLEVAAWLSTRRANTSESVDALNRQVPSFLSKNAVSVAVGEPGHDLKGFRRTHIQAGHARRVASLLSPRGGPITRYKDVAVAALCTTDLEHATTFAGNILGQLAADDEATVRLATTLATYLHENRSRTRTAKLLNVHPNTVSYRVRQAEELLGPGASDVDPLDLQVALTILPTLRST